MVELKSAAVTLVLCCMASIKASARSSVASLTRLVMVLLSKSGRYMLMISGKVKYMLSNVLPQKSLELVKKLIL